MTEVIVIMDDMLVIMHWILVLPGYYSCCE